MADPIEEYMRDFNRYTGDGLPDAPVDAPLPIGDPESGPFVPSKWQLRQWAYGIVSNVSALLGGGGLPLTERVSYDSRALASIAAGLGLHDDGREFEAQGVRYVKDADAPDNLFAINPRFHGRFEAMIADIQDGATVKFACYGDSTTDGNGTTGWTANPGGAAHTPANAWPVTAQSTLRSMMRTAAVTFWNAGYSGQQLFNGWARDNYRAAVIDNPGYGTPTATIIQFGINDLRQPTWSPDLFDAELRRLVSDIGSWGSFPIFMTIDPVANNVNNGARAMQVNEIYQSVGRDLGVKVIDWHNAALKLFSRPGAAIEWGTDQADDVHFGDGGHRAKGSFIAAAMFPNTLWLGDEDTINVAPWSKFTNQEGKTFTVFQPTFNAVGGAVVFIAGDYATDEFLQDIWAWNVGDDYSIYWAGVDGNGFWNPRNRTSGPRLTWADYTANVNTFQFAPQNAFAAGAGSSRSSEALVKLDRMPVGLSRIAFRAPTDNNTNAVFIGYFSFRRSKNAGSFAAVLPATTPEKYTDRDPFTAGNLVPGFGDNASMEMLIRAKLAPGHGVFLWSSRVYGTGVTRESNRKRGVMLFRHITNNVIYLYEATFDADGTGAIIGAALGSAAYTAWSEGYFRVSSNVDTVNQLIKVYDGFNGAAIIAFTRGRTSAPVIWGGTPGAFFQAAGAAAGVSSLEIVSLEVA